MGRRNFIKSFSPCSWIPNFYSLVFATRNNKRIEWMPFTRLHIVFVLGKLEFFFGCCKIENLCTIIVWTWNKLHTTWSEWKIIYSSLRIVSPNFVLLTKLCIRVNNKTILVPRNNILVKLWYSNRADLHFMQRSWLGFKKLCIPKQNLPRFCASNQSLSLFNPLNCILILLLLMH